MTAFFVIPDATLVILFAAIAKVIEAQSADPAVLGVAAEDAVVAPGALLNPHGILVEGNAVVVFDRIVHIRKIRHVLYKCAASRPSVESKTNEEEIEVQTETLSIKSTPMANGVVKAKTGDDTTDSVYQNWYQSVYLPANAAPAEEPANG